MLSIVALFSIASWFVMAWLIITQAQPRDLVSWGFFAAFTVISIVSLRTVQREYVDVKHFEQIKTLNDMVRNIEAIKKAGALEEKKKDG